jgi:hypothetical protein
MKADHREACRRRHRIVANWLALYTWKLGTDCIVLDSMIWVLFSRYEGGRKAESNDS